MTDVLCFGDSNTHGSTALTVLGERDRLPYAARWPAVAAAALGDGWTLVAEGQPGRTTVHPDPVEGGHKAGTAVLPALLESHRPIDIVAIMLGTNDLKHRFAATPTDIALGVERLVDVALRSGVGPAGGAPKVLVIAPVPVLETGVLAEIYRGGAVKSRYLGNALAAMAARSGVAFLDAGPVASVDPVDGIHLDRAAHRALGQAIAAALKQLAAGQGG